MIYQGQKVVQKVPIHEASRETLASEAYASVGASLQQTSKTPQERVRLSCLRVLHHLAGTTTIAEVMAATSVWTPQVVPLLIKAIGWQGGSILALETLMLLKVGLVEVLLGLLDWRAG
ncbi:DnaJ subfamily C grv2 [Castilleja foliolosa]|uniref:DnaJ subfamily C grv2 n=1 Tax=Castilleja foliolosa TaxID=1961234 RepID=A0ABD3DQ02_9LAMI